MRGSRSERAQRIQRLLSKHWRELPSAKVNHRAKTLAFRLTEALSKHFPAVRLTVELVPKPCWKRNLRSSVRPALWELIRSRTLPQTGSRCAVCGTPGDASRIECHEVWAYDDRTLVQSLADIVALCSPCHEVKHIGRAGLTGRGHIAKARLQELNQWTAARTEEYLALVWKIWRYRSRNLWHQNFLWLTDNGFRYKPRTRGLTLGGTDRQNAAGRSPKR